MSQHVVTVDEGVTMRRENARVLTGYSSQTRRIEDLHVRKKALAVLPSFLPSSFIVRRPDHRRRTQPVDERQVNARLRATAS